jgi:ABC-type branched-subunit amino acid transport system substrate-binding protein
LKAVLAQTTAQVAVRRSSVFKTNGERTDAFYQGLIAFPAIALVLLLSPAPPPAPRGIAATEIRIGQTMPYSGRVSAFGALGKGEVGYFKMVNERGGINGRKINLISLDDSCAPPKTVSRHGGWWRATSVTGSNSALRYARAV